MEFDSFNVSYDDFRQQFEGITDPMDAAMVATVYCGYGRVGEIVRGCYTRTPSIEKSHFKFTPTHLILTIHTEKTKQWRRVPTSRELEDWLHEPIRNYLGYADEGEVFPRTTRWAEYKFKKWFGTQHIHLLRHWACTHALQGHRSKNKLTINDIARLGGWTNVSMPFRVYGHYVTEDLQKDI